jgi:hypothetical protein
MANLAEGRTEDLSKTVPRLIDINVGLLCWDGQNTSPALSSLLKDCRTAARSISDSLNTLFFAHSAQTGRIVGV